MSNKPITDKAQAELQGKAMAEPSQRRGWLLGLGAAGAAAVVARALPGAAVEEVAEVASMVATPGAKSEAEGGYQLSPHVLRYYETARS